MRVLAHFRGGPIDGHTREIEEALPDYRVPAMPPIDFSRTDALIAPQHHIYRRAPGIVGSEVVYDYGGLA